MSIFPPRLKTENSGVLPTPFFFCEAVRELEVLVLTDPTFFSPERLVEPGPCFERFDSTVAEEAVIGVLTGVECKGVD